MELTRLRKKLPQALDELNIENVADSDPDIDVAGLAETEEDNYTDTATGFYTMQWTQHEDDDRLLVPDSPNQKKEKMKISEFL